MILVEVLQLVVDEDWARQVFRYVDLHETLIRVDPILEGWEVRSPTQVVVLHHDIYETTAHGI